VRVFRGVAFFKALPDFPDVFRKKAHLLGIPPTFSSILWTHVHCLFTANITFVAA
jgi:hypothetical protein